MVPGIVKRGPTHEEGPGPHRIPRTRRQIVAAYPDSRLALCRTRSLSAGLPVPSCSDPLEDEPDDQVSEQVGVGEPHAVAR